MKIKMPADPEVGFQMAPMIDITFLLLIFFMLVAKQATSQQKEIEPPIADHSTISKQLGDRGVITIDVNETLYIGAYEAEISEIADMVRKRVEANPQFKVLLRIDARVKHKDVREVLNACAEGGALDIIFSTYQSES